jgi:hypothetical protein
MFHYFQKTTPSPAGDWIDDDCLPISWTTLPQPILERDKVVVPTIDCLTVKGTIDSFSLWPKNASPYEVEVGNQQFENEIDR